MAFLLGMISFSPSLLTHGIYFPSGDPSMSMQMHFLTAGYYFLKVFGLFASIIVFFYLIIKVPERLVDNLDSSKILFHVSNIIIWVVLFMFLPMEPEYLLPMVPSIILLLDHFSSKKVFAAMTLLLLSYHFIQLDALGGESGKRKLHLSIRPGFSYDDIQDRIFKLSTRRAATQYRSKDKVLLMFGESWIPAANERWIFDYRWGLDKQRDGNLYLSDRIVDENSLLLLKKAGFKIYCWRGEKWEYSLSTDPYWQKYVEEVKDLSVFFHSQIIGKAINQR